MKSVFASLGACLCLPLAAAAAGTEPLQNIARAAETAVLAQLPPSATATANTIDPRLRLATCSQPLQTDPAAVRGAAATVTVRCPAPAWTLYVPVRISDMRMVAVLARPGQRGDVVGADMLTLQTRDVAQLPFGYVDDPASIEGQQLRRPIGAGAVLTPNDVEAPRWVRRGQIVTLIGRAGGLEVRAGGKALGDGAEGQTVRVQNQTSRRVVNGTVTAPGVVEVRL